MFVAKLKVYTGLFVIAALLDALLYMIPTQTYQYNPPWARPLAASIFLSTAFASPFLFDPSGMQFFSGVACVLNFVSWLALSMFYYYPSFS